MRRETLWLDLPATVATLAAASTAVLALSASAALLALRPFTIIRTRVNFFCRSDQNAISERYQAAYGECVVSDQAVAIGITAVPTPATDMASDLWFLHAILTGQTTGTSTVGFDGTTGQYIDVDSKAMRKVEEGQDTISVLETSSISSGAVVSIMGRQLIKLH